MQEGQGLGDDLRDRLPARRPVPAHHAAAGRHRPDRHARELAADAAGRRRRGRGERDSGGSRTPSSRSPRRATRSVTSRPTARPCARSRSAAIRARPRRDATAGGFVRNLWYVAAWSHEVPRRRPRSARTLIGEPIALYRRRDGTVVALEDRCPHRHAPLSLGRIEGDDLRCMYHGLRFGSDGVCVEVPGSTRVPPRLAARSFPVVERSSWIWVWPGDPAKADPALVPEAFGLDNPDWVMRASAMDYEADYQLLNDNLCDLSHLDFVHETTLGGSTGAKWSARAAADHARSSTACCSSAGSATTRWRGAAERVDTLNALPLPAAGCLPDDDPGVPGRDSRGERLRSAERQGRLPARRAAGGDTDR